MRDLGNKSVMASNIRFYMKLKEINAKDLSRALNVPYTTVLSWIKAEYYPRIDKIEMMADFFNCLKSDLIEDKKATSIDSATLLQYGIKPITTKRFRVLGEIACGTPIYANEEYETYIEASSDIRADFCLIAKGDSMINARIFDGDIVFIKEQPDVENGEIAAVIVDDEATLKRVYKYPNRIELRPENPIHEVLNYENEQLNNIRILGKAVAFQSYVK